MKELFQTVIDPDLSDDAYYILIDPGKLTTALVFNTVAAVDADLKPKMRSGVLDGRVHLAFEGPGSPDFMRELESRLYDAARENIPEMAGKTNREICRESGWDYSRGHASPIARPEPDHSDERDEFDEPQDRDIFQLEGAQIYLFDAGKLDHQTALGIIHGVKLQQTERMSFRSEGDVIEMAFEPKTRPTNFLRSIGFGIAEHVREINPKFKAFPMEGILDDYQISVHEPTAEAKAPPDFTPA